MFGGGVNGGARGKNAWFASTASGLAMVLCAAQAYAEAPQANTILAQASVPEEQVTITGRKAKIGVDRLPQAIEDQPQNVHVIDSVQLKEQAVVSLDQAVRNIPGITANVGEGGGATAGDQFRIRGFDAQNDISSDGLRDFGAYTRDSFNIESVQVFLGPSGQTFGRGSFGGAINTSSKVPRLDNFLGVQTTIGSANYLRTTVDWNHAIGDAMAVRLNVMGHNSDFADISEATSSRWGAAGSIGFGLGANTSFTTQLFHQSDDRLPYYGVPVVIPTGQTIARPLPVDRSTSYSTTQDRDITDADVLTTKFAHRPNENFQILNDTRIGVFAREFMSVAPSCDASCITNFFDSNPATIPMITRGGTSGPYYLDQWGAQNITTGIADFHVGGLKSQFVAGVDMTYENAERLNTSSYNASTVRPTTPALNPNPTWNNPVFARTTSRLTESTNFGLFASEQLWVTDEISVFAGIRADRYHIESDTTTFGSITSNVYTPLATPTLATTKVANDLFSPRLSLIWEPDDHKIFYASFARSSQPATGSASASVGTPITVGQEFLEPTTSETYELGARVGVLENKLNLGVSLFQTERDNSKETDPSTGGVIASGDQQRARGVEFNADGQLTSWWSVTASYTILDTETLFANAACSTAVGAALPCPVGVVNGTSVPNINAIGKPIPFAAEQAATLWTTVNPTHRLTLGIGARYTDAVWLNNTNLAQAPYYMTIEGLASYRFKDDLVLQLNGSNLADREENYDQVVAGRAAHAPGRAFTLMVSKIF